MNNKKYLLTILLLMSLYALFLVGIKFIGKEVNSIPVITIKDEILTVSVKDKEKALLKGVSASDTEDGDLTSKIVIDSISEFDEKNYRTVSYVVFDNNDQMAKATRRIKYSDYEVPVFDIKSPLMFHFVANNAELVNPVSAYSSLDGNVSNSILIENDFYVEGKREIRYSVTDSCGTKTTFTLKADEINGIPSIIFTLNDYLIRVDKGTEIDPWSYIEKIEYLGMNLTSNYENITIQNNYDSTTEGMYEFIYRYTDDTGEFGITKLVVIVE